METEAKWIKCTNCGLKTSPTAWHCVIYSQNCLYRLYTVYDNLNAMAKIKDKLLSLYKCLRKVLIPADCPELHVNYDSSSLRLKKNVDNQAVLSSTNVHNFM